MKSFEDLNCWKKASALRRRVSSLTKTFPKEEKYRLVGQMVRASRSVTANIAEGFGRFHYQEYIQYCRQARGSLYVILDHLTVAFEEHYLTKAKNHSVVSDPESTYNLSDAING
jgi:four helix bundle protein